MYEVWIFILNYVLPPFILVSGLVGNTFGFLVLQKDKNLIKIGPRDTYKYLFLSDSFYLIQIISSNLQYAYNLDITVVSDLTCKV